MQWDRALIEQYFAELWHLDLVRKAESITPAQYKHAYTNMQCVVCSVVLCVCQTCGRHTQKCLRPAVEVFIHLQH